MVKVKSNELNLHIILYSRIMYTPRLFVCYVFVPFSMSHFIYLLFFFLLVCAIATFVILTSLSHLRLALALRLSCLGAIWFRLAPIDSKCLNIDIGAR